MFNRMDIEGGKVILAETDLDTLGLTYDPGVLTLHAAHVLLQQAGNRVVDERRQLQQWVINYLTPALATTADLAHRQEDLVNRQYAIEAWQSELLTHY